MIQNEPQYMRVKRLANYLEFALLACRQSGEDALRTLLFENFPAGIRDVVLSTVTEEAISGHLSKLNTELALYDWDHYRDRLGNWNQTYTGRRFWPEDPRPQDIDIVDIAHSLARINRFNGHTRESYSVAQHAVLVSQNVPLRLRLFGLMHDAGECYLGDIVTPIKRLFREFYEPVEQCVMDAVATRYDFTMTGEEKRLVKRADTRALMTEFRDLTPGGVFNGEITELPLRERIDECWSADKSEERFLERFVELTRGRTKAA